jgi:hypothetical protein
MTRSAVLGRWQKGGPMKVVNIVNVIQRSYDLTRPRQIDVRKCGERALCDSKLDRLEVEEASRVEAGGREGLPARGGTGEELFITNAV